MSLKRPLSFLAVVLIIFMASRALIHALPGDPLETLMAETGTSIPKEQLRTELGLDTPFFQSMIRQMGAALRGDFGTSILSRRAVGPLLGRRFQNTLLLTVCSIALALSWAMTLAFLSTWSHGSRLGDRARRFCDGICSFHGALASALPTPWIGPLFAWFFSVTLGWFPIGNHLALPVLVLGFAFSGLWARLLRQRILETLPVGAASGARARGIPEWKVILKYGLAPASGSLLAWLGTQTGALLAGAFVVETLFDWPGMGQLLIEGVLKRDYPVVEAAVFAAATASVAGTWLGDWLQHAVDPRIREAAAHD